MKTFPTHSNLSEFIFGRLEQILVIGGMYGKWTHQGGEMEIFSIFLKKTKPSFFNVKNEIQLPGMIKVESAVVVKMSKRNENGEMIHFNYYMPNAARIFQNENENEIRENVMESMDEVNNKLRRI